MKRYIKPECEIIELMTEYQFLAASEKDPGTAYDEEGSGVWHSKGHNTDVWGFDEEDED